MRHAIRLSSIVVPSVAALLSVCGQARAQWLFPSLPVALTGAHAADLLGPNQGAANFSDLTSAGPSIIGGRVIFLGTTDAMVPAPAGNAATGGLWIWNGYQNHGMVKFTDYPSSSGLNSPVMNASGQWAFRDSTLAAASGGLYENPNGTTTKLVKIADDAPGTNTGTDPTKFAKFATGSSIYNTMLMNPSGSVAFNGSLAAHAATTPDDGLPVILISGATANFSGIWAGTPGALSLRIRQNDPVFTPSNVAIPNVFMNSMDTGAFCYNANGKLLVSTALQGSGVVTTPAASTNNKALVSTRNGFNEIIARKGDAFPDASGTLVSGVPATDAAAYNALGTTNNMNMNNAGRVVFNSSLRTAAGGTPSANGTSAMFSDQDGTLKTVARETVNLPAATGLSSLKWGSGWGSVAVINGANTIAFVNTGMTGTDPNTNVAVTSSANAGLFKRDSSGNLTKIFRTGDPAPAFSAVSGNPSLTQNAGAVFFGAVPATVDMNSSGQMAFVLGTSGLNGPGIVGSGIGNGNSTLFGVDTDGTFFLLAQRHMLFHVGPSDDRIVSGIQLIGSSGGEDGRASGLDEYGNITFMLTFTSVISATDTITSSGVFVTHIPAPGGAALLGLGGLLAARRRRR